MEKDYEAASNCLKALAHPIRLKILHCLKKGERSVTKIEQFCGQYTQSNISQHLGMMKAKGIIKSVKIGNHMLYSVSNKEIYKVLDIIARAYCKS